ncbi:MAG TPA: hypothetical protein VH021_04565 [Trebonia sp.]|nr:hypothetical protein [Trebonia sp.]
MSARASATWSTRAGNAPPRKTTSARALIAACASRSVSPPRPARPPEIKTAAWAEIAARCHRPASAWPVIDATAAADQSGAASCRYLGAESSQPGPAAAGASRSSTSAASSRPVSISASPSPGWPVASRQRPSWNLALASPMSRSSGSAAGALRYMPMTSRSSPTAAALFPAWSDASATRVSTSIRATS